MKIFVFLSLLILCGCSNLDRNLLTQYFDVYDPKEWEKRQHLIDQIDPIELAVRDYKNGKVQFYAICTFAPYVVGVSDLPDEYYKNVLTMQPIGCTVQKYTYSINVYTWAERYNKMMKQFVDGN